MIKKISFKLAVITMLVVFICTIMFHLLVLVGIIPFNIVWGGRLENASQMRLFESISIIINLLIIIVVAIKGRYIKPFIPEKIINFILWMFVVLFILNTIGNLFAVTSIEAIIATPLTLIAAVFCYRMLIEKQSMSVN